MQTEFFKIDILSPVHIGTGDELDPMAYIMQREDGEAVCYVLDIQSWAGDYPEPEELSNVFSGDNIPAMRNFLATRIDPNIYGMRRIVVGHEHIIREYEQKLSDRRSSHQLLLSPHMSASSRIPLIPGSSIKGAVRTAVIDWLDREKRLGLKAARAKDNKGRAYQKQIEAVLGPIRDNAFKQLKISDVKGYADSTLLVEPYELRRKEGKPGTPKNKCEVMPSRMLGKVEQSALYARIAIGAPNNPSDRKLTLAHGHGWQWFELADLVNAYFLGRFEQERAKFYGMPNFSKSRPINNDLADELRQCANGQMILRLGHYSQVEFVTVTENQPLTRKTKDGKPMPYGTTRTLANGLFPFGWVRLTPCSEAEYRKGTARCEAANEAIMAKRELRRHEVVNERKMQIAESQKREEMARKEAEAEARREAELAALSADERDIVLLQSGELNENQVFEVFNRLDSMDAPLRKQAAAALKELWIKENRWRKKACSKKQAAKVSLVKKILNGA